MNKKKINYLNYDIESDSIQISIKSGREEEYKEIVPGINVEFNKEKEVIGIEILRASRFFKSIVPKLKKKIEFS
jgi:uncharacterized protein YuzE